MKVNKIVADEISVKKLNVEGDTGHNFLTVDTNQDVDSLKTFKQGLLVETSNTDAIGLLRLKNTKLGGSSAVGVEMENSNGKSCLFQDGNTNKVSLYNCTDVTEKFGFNMDDSKLSCSKIALGGAGNGENLFITSGTSVIKNSSTSGDCVFENGC